MTRRRGGHRFSAEGDFVQRLEGRERRELVPQDGIVSRMALTRGQTVLDLGSGTGYFTLPIADRAGEVVALDMEPKMLRVLSQRVRECGIGNIHQLLGDMMSLPLADESVDRVFAAFVYHEADSQKALVDQCQRVLRRGGRLTIVDFQKRETPIGPPVSERKSPAHVTRTCSKGFKAVGRHETKVYYQLEFEKS